MASDLVDEILAGYEDTEVDRATAILEKKYQRKLSGPNGRQNVTAALARMGFRLEDIRTAMSQFLVWQTDKADEFQDIGE